mmetsp:Transcript_99889/g.258108  ORF Transcript_99889/g.258108 Transcript_99889/m.258108 type:complete len:218 (+) Transcript_99889:1930-2583(+)
MELAAIHGRTGLAIVEEAVLTLAAVGALLRAILIHGHVTAVDGHVDLWGVLEEGQVAGNIDADARRTAGVPSTHLLVQVHSATYDLPVGRVALGGALNAVALVPVDVVYADAESAAAVLQVGAVVFVLTPQILRPSQVLGTDLMRRAIIPLATHLEPGSAGQGVDAANRAVAMPAAMIVVQVRAALRTLLVRIRLGLRSNAARLCPQAGGGSGGRRN